MTTQKRRVGPVSAASAVGAAAATFVAWLVSAIFDLTMPENVELALGILIAAGGSILGGWIVKPGSGKRVAQ